MISTTAASTTTNPSGNLEDEFANYALTLTTVFNYSNQISRKILEIKAPVLKQVCKDIIGDKYTGVSFKTDKVAMNCPPKVLFFYYKEFEAERLLEEKSIPELVEDIRYLTLFIRFIKTELRDEITNFNSLTPQGLITYDLLWTIFPPQSLILVHTHSNEKALLRLVRGVEVDEGCDPGYHLDAFQVDHDGYTFGYIGSGAHIPPFEGTLAITDLPVVPLNYIPDKEALVADLVERGRKSEKLQAHGPSYQSYKGLALGPILNRRRTYFSINGRVMVDPATFARVNTDRAISVTSLHAAKQFLAAENNDPYRSDERDMYDDGHNGLMLAAETRHFSHETEERVQAKGRFYRPLTDEEASLVTPFVRGFALAEKKWAEFAVRTLAEVQWVDDAFSKLVLPAAQKELILSLVEAPEEAVGKYRFDDFIPSKGLGLVAVLHGPPGVGKTLTAESVAEYTRRPLYSVTSGELGTNPVDLESTLAVILDVAGAWDAILLIDEADIFLEARGSGGEGGTIKRNAMVGIFLRLLEYFKGVMFLTTNRVEKFDPAFKSRIHLALKYDTLTLDAREEVWSNFVGKVPAELVEESLLGGDEPGVTALAKSWEKVNGREIKNAVKTGLRIAGRRKVRLSEDILAGVLALGAEFDAQMNASGTIY
ncbi:hypothetical protein DFH27DRAFT_479117 [Peziza echinospora]|nr:hypothetical protein DFH27DRAFT_479117 [Peziza echinospora]